MRSDDGSTYYSDYGFWFPYATTEASRGVEARYGLPHRAAQTLSMGVEERVGSAEAVEHDSSHVRRPGWSSKKPVMPF